jgi:hypothetical protein
MTAKFIKVEKPGRAMHRLFGPKAREVFARDWAPDGWSIVGEGAPQGAPVGVAEAVKEAAGGGEPEAGDAAEAGDGEAAAEMAPRRKKKASAGRGAGDGGA